MKRKRFAAGICVLAVTLGAMSLSGAAFADKRDDLVQQEQKQKDDLESLQSSLEGVDTNLQDVYLKLKETEQQIPVAKADLAAAQDALAAAQREQETVAANLDAAQGQLNSIRADIESGKKQMDQVHSNLGEIARAQYRGETVPSTLDLLFGSSSSEEFQDAYAAAQAVTRTENSTLSQVEEITAQNLTREARQSDVENKIADLKKQADDLVAKQTELTADAQKKSDALAALQSTYQEQSKDMEAKKAEFQQSISDQQSAIDSTQAAIDEIDRENAAAAAAAAAAAKAQAAQQNAGGSGGSGAVSGGGSWLIPVIPVPFYVTSPYGMREYPFGGYWMHTGTDIRSACGAPQIAPGNGTIAKVIPALGNSTHGNQIYINLGIVNGSSWVVVTNHLSAFNVVAGQTVKQGDVIGWTGQTGQVTGCHVHLEVWKDGKSINPESLPGFTRSN